MLILMFISYSKIFTANDVLTPFYGVTTEFLPQRRTITKEFKSCKWFSIST